jgi:(1->4)-alpha-D-glucan 1-alpha-D-glucosylmutase
MDNVAPPPPASQPSGEDDLRAQALFDSVSAALRNKPPAIPSSTCRMQIGGSLTLTQVADLVEYLKALGIGAVYASPFLRAREGSTHGYDVVDHGAIHPAAGTLEDFERLARQLRDAGLGLILDFVPNHMGIGPDNAWWQDVLENGQSSIYAPWFDIDWAPLQPQLRDKVLLPILGDHYGRVLEDGQIRLTFENGQFAVRYFEHVLPVNPRAWPMVLRTLVPALQAARGEEDEAVLELQSILTGLEHLPPRTETRRAKMVERRREKEILRKRLATLLAEHADIASALDGAMARVNGTPGLEASFDELDALLSEQAWRLCYWRVAAEEINYRRFFDTNDLAAIRMEVPAVFAQAHRLVLSWVQRGLVTGLRIDHPDGLWDPQRYFEQLQREVFLLRCLDLHAGELEAEDREVQQTFARLRPRLEQLHAQQAENPRAPQARPLWLVAEKILTRGEVLPEEWPIHGTVGYEFAAGVTQLLVDPAGGPALTETYERFVGLRVDFEELVYAGKRLILRTSLASELSVLAQRLARLSGRDRHSRDFTLGTLHDALREIVASWPVYRTYVTERSTALAEHDRTAVTRAVRGAMQRNGETEPSIWRFLMAILTLEVPPTVRAEDRPLWRQWVMQLQQLTSPVMAKGVEDTAFYTYNRLLALAEVGSEPDQLGLDLAAFHRSVAQRQRTWPHALLSTSTHDTKRSEDVRARLLVLSEVPALWQTTLDTVSALAAAGKTEVEGRKAPDRNEEVLIYQTVLGAMPIGLLQPDAEFTDRVVEYVVKACKEAKVHTSWLDPRTGWTEAVEGFVRQLLAPNSAGWLAMQPLAELMTWHGYWNSLTQVVLKCMAPGVPDLYQGQELWDFSLVDPDNRRPVDWELRKRLLATLDGREPLDLARELAGDPSDGRLKMLVTRACLHLRRDEPECFGEASVLTPLSAEGQHAPHVIAWSRRAGTREVVVIVPRWTCKRTEGRRILPVGELWAETVVPIPEGAWTEVVTRRRLQTRDLEGRPELALAEAWQVLPLAILVRDVTPPRS